MMDDRKMLELAALAFWGDEIDDVCSIRYDETERCIAYIHGDNQDHNGQDREFLWNPLEDDGQALRMAVKLYIRVFGPGYASTPDGRPCIEGVGSDEEANTRRAITRAAAEIGKSLKGRA